MARHKQKKKNVKEHSLSKKEEDDIDKALREIREKEESRQRARQQPEQVEEEEIEEIPRICPGDVVDNANTGGNLANRNQLSDRQRREVEKRYQTKLGVMYANRKKEMAEEDNVKYNKNGKRIGRMEKQMIHVPSGNLDVDSMDMKNLYSIVSSLASQPEQLSQFMNKLGLDAQGFEKMKEQLESKVGNLDQSKLANHLCGAVAGLKPQAANVSLENIEKIF